MARIAMSMNDDSKADLLGVLALIAEVAYNAQDVDRLGDEIQENLNQCSAAVLASASDIGHALLILVGTEVACRGGVDVVNAQVVADGEAEWADAPTEA